MAPIPNGCRTYLRIPNLLFLQEIQDNSEPQDDGTVSTDLTL